MNIRSIFLWAALRRSLRLPEHLDPVGVVRHGLRRPADAQDRRRGELERYRRRPRVRGPSSSRSCARRASMPLPATPSGRRARRRTRVRRGRREQRGPGPVLVRLLGVDTRTQVSTTMVPGGMGWGRGRVGRPGRPHPRTMVPVQQVSQYDLATVETKLFDVQTKQLVWAATTSTFNPRSVAGRRPRSPISSSASWRAGHHRAQVASAPTACGISALRRRGDHPLNHGLALFHLGQIAFEEEIDEGPDHRDGGQAPDFIPAWREGGLDDVGGKLKGQPAHQPARVLNVRSMEMLAGRAMAATSRASSG